MITLKDFSIGYGTRKLLERVTTTIPSGTLTALIGRNGTGKSTLLKAIGGLNPNYDGDINLSGEGDLPRRLAYVTTERVRIANLTCHDVVALGRAPYTDWIGRLTDTDEEIIDQALADVGMSDYKFRTLDRMSDGECQRVMIARALAQATPIIILDEPTSFLDLPNRYHLCELLRHLAHDEGKCILFSTHELDIALKLADRILLIDSPQLKNLTPEEIRQSGIMEEVFGLKV